MAELWKLKKAFLTHSSSSVILVFARSSSFLTPEDNINSSIRDTLVVTSCWLRYCISIKKKPKKQDNIWALLRIHLYKLFVNMSFFSCSIFLLVNKWVQYSELGYNYLKYVCSDLEPKHIRVYAGSDRSHWVSSLSPVWWKYNHLRIKWFHCQVSHRDHFFFQIKPYQYFFFMNVARISFFTTLNDL